MVPRTPTGGKDTAGVPVVPAAVSEGGGEVVSLAQVAGWPEWWRVYDEDGEYLTFFGEPGPRRRYYLVCEDGRIAGLREVRP